MNKKYKQILAIISLTLVIYINMVTTKHIYAEVNYTIPTYTSAEKEEIEKAIIALADAYYRRGVNAQYAPERRSSYLSPEETTSQNTTYNVCSGYVHSIYYQAFEMDTPVGTAALAQFASDNKQKDYVLDFYEKTYDGDGNVTGYIDKNGTTHTGTSVETYGAELLSKLQVGDVLLRTSTKSLTGEGHTMIVYGIIRDQQGNPTDILIREATSKWQKDNVKVTKGFSYTNILNTNTGQYEGVYQERYLLNSYPVQENVNRAAELVYFLNSANSKNMKYFIVIRPIWVQEWFKGNTDTEKQTEKITLTNETRQRLTYKEIEIEKTVDVSNQSVINLGDTIEYTIRVKNNSTETYANFNIVENISEYVDVTANGNGTVNNNKITWEINGLQSKQEITKKYKVKVKSNVSNLGKEVISTGTVAGIPSSTIKNTISYNLSTNSKNSIKTQTSQSINNTNTVGKNLISKIYTDALGENINLNSLDLYIQPNDTIENLNNYNDGSHLILTLNQFSYESIVLSDKNKFINTVLPRYYGALYTTSTSVAVKGWSHCFPESKYIRNDTIYINNLQTGDILIYKNTQTPSEGKTYEAEDGYYYLIFLEESDKITVNGEQKWGFIGKDDSGNIKTIATDYVSMQTILAKDYYVIIRPSMTLNILSDNTKASDLVVTSNKNIIKNITIYKGLNNLISTNATISINNNAGVPDNYQVKTSDKLKATFSDKEVEYVLSVRGDVTGTGNPGINDAKKIAKHIIDKNVLNDEYLYAADYNNDNNVKMNDVMKILKEPS